ncbi:MAG: hypothetical protein ACM4AI_24530 [Acidobacteriota bacterium]
MPRGAAEMAITRSGDLGSAMAGACDNVIAISSCPRSRLSRPERIHRQAMARAVGRGDLERLEIHRHRATEPRVELSREALRPVPHTRR